MNIDKYQELCNYIMELSEYNQMNLEKARNTGETYSNAFFDLLSSEEILYLLKNKIEEIERGNR